ncbi:MAG: hypothetical protein A2089_12635 [Elusimicrobia bacterium GWD2_63_28]|nr:MAG: hypothetical protein A2089_12635 [Elusimicrobia bacterium GWD2_63_28]
MKPDHGRHVSFMADLLADASAKLRAGLIMGPRLGASGQLRFSGGKKFVSFKNCCFDVNPYGSSLIANDKGLSRLVLQREGVRMPRGRYFSPGADEFRGATLDALVKSAGRYAEKLGFPVMAKGATLHRGSGVIKASDRPGLEKAVRALFRKTPGTVVEKFVPLTNFRLLVFDGEVVAAYGKAPFQVEGDGRTEAGELIARKQRECMDIGYCTDFSGLERKISANLRQAGYSRGHIVPKGKRLVLLDVANVSTGGAAWDCTGELHRAFKPYCAKVMRVLNLRFAGLDILARDVSESPEKALLLEVNPSPSLETYSKMGPRQREKIAALLERILSESRKLAPQG